MTETTRTRPQSRPSSRRRERSRAARPALLRSLELRPDGRDRWIEAFFLAERRAELSPKPSG